MKAPHFVIVFLLLVVISLLGFGLYQQSRPDEWQYTIIAPDDSKLRGDLDTAGALGWEIVSARRATGEGTKASYEMIMKKRGVSPTTPATFLQPKGE